ncbi:MAG TPA: adenosine deaminase, partial [Candidatus Baltobacteraceae bacterium]
MRKTSENIDALIDALPKAELHVHIEGTFEPELIFALAERQGLAPPHASLEALHAAYNFSNLQSFLDLYYGAISLLRSVEDFHMLARAYFRRAAAQGVVRAEVFFDPQAHLARGVAFETILEGLEAAIDEAQREYQMSVGLIMCFLRDRSADDAMATLERALPFGDRILGVGLDSAEVGHPPSKFVDVFARARANGWKAVAHAGEEGPPQFVWETLDLLQVARIDHGVRALEDAALVERLRRERMPLTV